MPHFKGLQSCTRFFVSTLLFCVVVFDPQFAKAQSNPEKEFVMSCTYGVLAGTLVGAASLAFVDKPGDNLQRVARGASIGLYAGIALGYYTVYYLPKKFQEEEEYRLNPDNVFNESKKNLDKVNWALLPSVSIQERAPVMALSLEF